MYKEIVNNFLSVTKKFGGKTGQQQQVEFFFYADSEDKGSNLAIELSRLGYEVYGVEKSNDSWSIIGATPAMIINNNFLTEWCEAMYELADKMEVHFDGWGMLMEK